MASWRDELGEAVKPKAEREAEELARSKKRVEEALATATQALNLGLEAMKYAHERLVEKGQAAEHALSDDQAKLKLGEHTLTLELVRDAAIVRLTSGEQKPRDFDFAKDRHIAPADVEEYVGRRILELVRNAYKSQPW